MYIMADLADDQGVAYIEERPLVAIKAHPDGSFDMKPGFSKKGLKYRFEDSAGVEGGGNITNTNKMSNCCVRLDLNIVCVGYISMCLGSM